MEDTKSLQKYNKLAKAIQKENPFFLMDLLSMHRTMIHVAYAQEQA